MMSSCAYMRMFLIRTGRQARTWEVRLYFYCEIKSQNAISWSSRRARRKTNIRTCWEWSHVMRVKSVCPKHMQDTGAPAGW